MVKLVIWDAISPIMTSLHCGANLDIRRPAYVIVIVADVWVLHVISQQPPLWLDIEFSVPLAQLRCY